MKRLIVDGYNVIRLVIPYAQLAESDLDAARTALISDVAAFAHDEWDATVVFDGAGNPASTGEPHCIAGITVVFSPHGRDADGVIEGLSRDARESGEAVEVVTSDAQMQWTVMGGSAVRRSASEFADALRGARDDWEGSNPTGSSAVRIEDRVSPAVRRGLERMLRGKD